MSTEPELLQLAYQLNTTALAEIYDTYSPGLYRYAMRLLGDAPLADDCVSEAFTRLLQSLQKQNGPREHLQAYLYRIAHNWIVDFYRHREEACALSESLECEDVPEEEAAERIQQKEIREAIFNLTPDQQEVILLKYMENWSNEEVARVLRKPVGAVKSLQHRALANLQKVFMECTDEQPI